MSTLGKFVWYELMTTDVAAASAFYSAIVGWDIKDSGMPGMQYSILHSKGVQIGGVMAIPPHAAGMPPNWGGYVAVPDVDEYCKRVESLKGKVMRPGTDIPTVGRFAVVKDPGGVPFVLFKGTSEQPLFADPTADGSVGWNELHGADPHVSFAFYSELFGWTKSREVDMGPMGVYLVFAINGVDAGGMMLKPANMPASTWLYYFNVPSADAAAAAITSAGGKVLAGPHEVPTKQWIVQGLDPQGAMFAVVAPVR
jgi:predicted enzyme related to lactoylglutathione lyase